MVTKTTNRRRRANRAAAPFGCFSNRDWSQEGEKASQLLNSQSTRPKKGPRA